MSASRLRLVTFDVTNTLIRLRGSPGKQYGDVAKKFGIEVDETVLTNIWLQKYKQYSVKYPNFGASINMAAKTWWDELVKDCFRSLDPDLEEDVLVKVADSLFIHFSTTSAWELLPGADAAIKNLLEYDVKTAIISNWDHRLYKLLDALQLRQCFDFVLPSYVMGMEKPDPGIFLRALKDAKCKPEEAVHFGDHVEKDFIAARNVGMLSYLQRTDGILSDFLDQNFVVHNAQSFVDAIRPRLGNLSEAIPESTV